jgi:integrase/recombinase XerD
MNVNVTDDFIVYLREYNNCNDITINSYLRTIRAFLYWLMEGGYIKRFRISIPRADKKIKETYSEAELNLLLKKPDIKKCDFIEYRMWAFSNYLLATGNRISSALNLLVCDIDFGNSLITINKTKNRKAQIIPMSKVLSNVLKEYLQYRGDELTDYVFCTETGGKSALRTFQDALADYNRSRGVMKTSAHLYRHTFAKQWILNGGDIFRLQKILGHSDLTVVKEYVQMFGNDLSIDFDRFNPLDQLGMNNKQNKIKMQ